MGVEHAVLEMTLSRKLRGPCEPAGAEPEIFFGGGKLCREKIKKKVCTQTALFSRFLIFAFTFKFTDEGRKAQYRKRRVVNRSLTGWLPHTWGWGYVN